MNIQNYKELKLKLENSLKKYKDMIIQEQIE